MNGHPGFLSVIKGLPGVTIHGVNSNSRDPQRDSGKSASLTGGMTERIIMWK